MGLEQRRCPQLKCLVCTTMRSLTGTSVAERNKISATRPALRPRKPVRRKWHEEASGCLNSPSQTELQQGEVLQLHSNKR